jgi:hypothetical protein
MVKKGPLKWVNVYGASGQEGWVNHSKKLAAKMNENPTIATQWNGRILCSTDSKDTERPILKTQKITSTFNVEESIELKKYTVRI